MFTQETASCKDDADALSSRQYPEGFYIFYVRKRTKTWKYGVRTHVQLNMVAKLQLDPLNDSWLYLICLLFCCRPDTQSKNAKKKGIDGLTADGWKEAILFLPPMGQASCCYCNCLSMQKSCLTKQTILLLMNAAAVQRCLSFWKSRFYGSFFFENRKLINYFCFTYLPAISFLQILSSSSFWF